MKYYTTAISFFLLNFIVILMLLYYGEFTREFETNINQIKSEIKDLRDKIQVNELEYAIHVSPGYLKKLEQLYLKINYDKNSELNIVGIQDFNIKSIQKILKVNVK